MTLRSTAPPPPSVAQPASTEEAGASDPFLLSWGSSVNVCEDLRRSIRTEIDDVESSIVTLHGNIKNEDRTSAQLAKDLAHARAEMVGLRRGASDVLDGAAMKDQVRTGLKASLKAELTIPMTQAAPEAPETLNGSSVQGKTTNVDKTPPTITAYLKQRALELKDLSVSVANEKENLMQMTAKKNDLEGEMQSVLRRIESDNVVAELAAMEKESAFRKEEFENESRRKNSTKDTVQQVRAQCGQHAQLIADNTKTLTAEKAKSEAKEAELALSVKQLEEKLRSSDSAAELELQLATMSRQLVKLNEDLDAFDATRKLREQAKAECGVIQKETEQLAKSKEELEAEMSNAQAKYEASVLLVQEAKAAQAAVEEERVANDKVQDELILPGQSEKNRLTEEKQDLAHNMSKLHEEKVAHEKEHSKGLADQSDMLKKLDENYKCVSDDLAKKRSLAHSIKLSKEKADSAAQKEVQGHKEFRTKFEEATEAESKRIVELRSERNREKRERVEEARVQSSRMRAELERKLKIFRMGADTIENAGELEKQ